MPGVVESVDERTGALSREVTDLRIVAVHHEHGLFREVPDGGSPALRDVLELSVAVELVAKQVPQADGARPDTAGDVGHGGLVDLEQSELGAPRGEQGGGDPGGEIRSRGVVSEPNARR